KSKSNGMLTLGVGQPQKRVVRIVEQGINRGYFISRHPLLLPMLDDFIEDFSGLVIVAGGRQHVRSFGASGGRVAGEDSLLVIRRQGFRDHALSFVSPTQDCMGRNAARVELE